MLVNGTMFNSEAWHNIMDKDIIPMEKVDEALLRQLHSAHSKTPLEALHLETNSLPLRYMLKTRPAHVPSHLTTEGTHRNDKKNI